MKAEQLLPQLYQDLRRLAAAKLADEPLGHTLTPTALVHEAFLRLRRERFPTQLHFFRAAAVVMRRILVDHARSKRAQKRGPNQRADVDPELLTSDDKSNLELLDEALTRLAQVEPQVAELVQLRYFTGLTIEEAAEALGISPRTANTWWAYARGWLADDLNDQA